MNKIILALIILIVIVGGWYLISRTNTNKIENLSFVEIIDQAFPDHVFIQSQNREDCFYDRGKLLEQYPEGEGFTDIYCIDNIETGQFDKKQTEALVITLAGHHQITPGDIISLDKETKPWYPHITGIYHAYLSVFDLGEKIPISETLHLIANSAGAIETYSCQKTNKDYILFASEGGWQGAMFADAQLFELKDRKFNEILTLNDLGIDRILIQNNKTLKGYENISESQFTEWVHTTNFAWNNSLCEFEKL